jgi:hypothetical protein
MTGGTGSFISGNGGGGGGGGGGSNGSSNAQNVGQGGIQGQQLATGIATTGSVLNSFNNVGTGSGQNSTISSANPLAAYYYNPMAQGLINTNSSGSSTASNVGFGQPLYGNLSTGGGGTLSGRGGAGNAFGGTSTSNRGSFGSVGSTGGLSSLNGTATVRGTGTGTTGTIAPSFTGGSWGPAIGRRGPVIGATLRGPMARPLPLASRQIELQRMMTESTRFSGPAGITVTTDGNTVVLTGTVATADDRRIAENTLRTHPGVSAVRNELRVTLPANP